MKLRKFENCYQHGSLLNSKLFENCKLIIENYFYVYIYYIVCWLDLSEQKSSIRDIESPHFLR